MTEKVHGVSFPGESISGNMNFYQVRTLLDIRPNADMDVTNTAQKRFDALIRAIALRAQPLVRGSVVVSVEDADDITDIPAAAALSGNQNVYVFKFAIDFDQAWEVDGNSPTLAETLNGVEGFVYTYPTTNNNVAITYSQLM